MAGVWGEKRMVKTCRKRKKSYLVQEGLVTPPARGLLITWPQALHKTQADASAICPLCSSWHPCRNLLLLFRREVYNVLKKNWSWVLSCSCPSLSMLDSHINQQNILFLLCNMRVKGMGGRQDMETAAFHLRDLQETDDHLPPAYLKATLQNSQWTPLATANTTEPATIPSHTLPSGDYGQPKPQHLSILLPSFRGTSEERSHLHPS